MKRKNLYKWAACALLALSLCSAQIITGIHPFLLTGRTQEAVLQDEEMSSEGDVDEFVEVKEP